MKALILGASGLIGGHLLKSLIHDQRVTNIKCLVRSPQKLQHDKVSEVIVDFNELDKWGDEFEVDTVFCCLGTTIKKAGSKAGFERVDHDYVLKSAQLFNHQSRGHFLFVSSQGADSDSSMFYSQVKGKTELGLKTLNLTKLTIIRPSLLLGDRDEFRPLESFGKIVSKPLNHLLQGSWRKYRSVEGREVAELMKAEALGDEYKSFIEVERV